jgi:hypothetical protein
VGFLACNSITNTHPFPCDWKAARQVFKRNLEWVRMAVNEFRDGGFMDDKDLARYDCYNLGTYRDPSLYLCTEFRDALKS